MKDKMDRLILMVYQDMLEKREEFENFQNEIDVSNRARKTDRNREEDAKLLLKKYNIEEIDVDTFINNFEEIYSYLLGLTLLDISYCTIEEILELNKRCEREYNAKRTYELAQEIQVEIESKKDKTIKCWNADTKRYETLEYDEEDYDRLCNLNIIKKINTDGYTCSLYYLDEDLHCLPMSRYITNTVDDWQYISINRSGNINDIRKDNYEVRLAYHLQEDIKAEFDAGKLLSQWYKINYVGDKLENELTDEVNKRAEDITKLMSDAEDILKEDD